MAMYLVPPALERPDFRTERLMFEDAVQRFYTDDGHGDGRFAPQWKQMETIAFMESVSGEKMYDKKVGVINQFDLFASFLSQPFACFAIAGRKEALDHYDASMKRLIGDPNDSLSDAVKAMAIADKEYVESMNAHGARFLHCWEFREWAWPFSLSVALVLAGILNGLVSVPLGLWLNSRAEKVRVRVAGRRR
jgi:hypothetical protein